MPIAGRAGGGTAPLLVFDAVACVRGDRRLFEGVSFALGAGEALLVRGPNGAGKSSLLRLAAGLLRPVAGRIERGAAASLAAEAAALDPEAPLGRALGWWAAVDGVRPSTVAAAQAAMGIAALAEVPVRLLSTGQRARAVIARTIATGARLWLLDEPGNGLDAAALDALGATIAAHRRAGGAVVAASHQPLPLADAAVLAL